LTGDTMLIFALSATLGFAATSLTLALDVVWPSFTTGIQAVLGVSCSALPALPCTAAPKLSMAAPAERSTPPSAASAFPTVSLAGGCLPR
jgi:hypothetical protein